ncbi:MAG: hypothetical protein RL210_769, partial [Pseudomonadota bacterium]
MQDAVVQYGFSYHRPNQSFFPFDIPLFQVAFEILNEARQGVVTQVTFDFLRLVFFLHGLQS